MAAHRIFDEESKGTVEATACAFVKNFFCFALLCLLELLSASAFVTECMSDSNRVQTLPLFEISPTLMIASFVTTDEIRVDSSRPPS